MDQLAAAGVERLNGRPRGVQQGHPSYGRDLLPSERCDEVIDHHPVQCGQFYQVSKGQRRVQSQGLMKVSQSAR